MNNKDKLWLENRINEWLMSEGRAWQCDALRYYCGKHDIYSKQRQAIDENGTLKDVSNLPNNIICNNLYKVCADQKSSYLLSKPMNAISKNVTYDNYLKRILGAKFKRTLMKIGKSSINCGVGYMYPSISDGELVFRYLDPTEMLVFYNDSERTEVRMAVRYYGVKDPLGTPITKVELWTKDGVDHYIWKNALVEEGKHEDYLSIIYSDEDQQVSKVGYNWGRVPIIPFKANSAETPLLNGVKTLQDAINEVMSQHQDTLSEDMRNTILVIKNYEGANLGEFRHNLSTYGAVNVGTVDGVSGDVETLNVKVDSSNYEIVLKELKRALILNARAYDPTDELMNSRPNELNLLALYSTINLDANEMEMEYEASFEDVKYFIDKYLEVQGKGSFSNDELNVKFHRDVIIDEASRLDSFSKMWGILSKETCLEHNPWVNNTYLELKSIENDYGTENDYFGGEEVERITVEESEVGTREESN